MINPLKKAQNHLKGEEARNWAYINDKLTHSRNQGQIQRRCKGQHRGIYPALVCLVRVFDRLKHRFQNVLVCLKQAG